MRLVFVNAMDKGFLISSTLVTAASGLVFWALLKLYETRSKLKALIEKYNDPKSSQRCLMHQYGTLNHLPLLKGLIPNDCEFFHQRVAGLCRDACDKYKTFKKRVLDVGCSTGALSFHLSKYFDEVIGTDTSYFMTVTCQMLKDNLETTGIFPTEGGLHCTSFRSKIPTGCKIDKVKFWDEDASNLDYTCGIFSCIVVANTLTEMSKPQEFLKNIANYVTKGGLLIIADTYNFQNGPENELEAPVGTLKTFEILKKSLQQKWEFMEELNFPYYFAICERRAEVGNAHVTVWKRKPDPEEV